EDRQCPRVARGTSRFHARHHRRTIAFMDELRRFLVGHLRAYGETQNRAKLGREARSALFEIRFEDAYSADPNSQLQQLKAVICNPDWLNVRADNLCICKLL